MILFLFVFFAVFSAFAGSLLRRNGQIAVFKRNVHVLFIKARNFYIQNVRIFGFFDIGLHRMMFFFIEKRFEKSAERIVEKVKFVISFVFVVH